MIIFSDYHHDKLWKSLEYLFEKRLGHKLYRPVGMEWYPEWWKIGEPYGSLGKLTANQYLSLKGNSPQPDGTFFYDELRGVTLEKFKEMPFDILIASIPAHVEPYKKLISLYHPNAKLIFQMGNMFSVDFRTIPNLLSSTISFPVPSSCNAVFYHQEFDTDLFCYQPPVQTKNIYSFLHTFDNYPDAHLYYEVEKLMPEWTFRAFGASNRDVNLAGEKEIVSKLQESRFVWHVKAGGDGYGHAIHNAFAVGRPPIVIYDYYKDKLAGQLMKDGETCIFIDKLTAPEIVTKILEYNDEATYQKMSEATYNRFKEIVDFDKETESIKSFLEKLY